MKTNRRYFRNTLTGSIWFYDLDINEGNWRFPDEPNINNPSNHTLNDILKNDIFSEITKEEANDLCRNWYNKRNK